MARKSGDSWCLKSIALVLAATCGALGCAESTDDTREIIENLVRAGFPRNDMTIVDGTVYVGRDAEVSLATSREMLRTDDSHKEQYRTTNTVGTSITKICIDGSTIGGVFSTALDLAIQNYNEQLLSFAMARTPSVGCSATINVVLSPGVDGGVSGFPSGGVPFLTINIGDKLSAYSVDTIVHVITHEIGHTIGLRHSDFFDRSISCGTGGNEGDAGVGAINVPGTPTGATVGGSVMNSCFRTIETGQFTPSDVTALRSIYGWTGWSEVGGGGTTNLPLTATIFNNRLYLFGVAIGSNHEFMNSFDGNVWSGWTEVGGGGTTNLPLTATVFNNRLYLFCVAIGSNHEFMNSFDGNVWSGWTEVGGSGTTNLPLTATVFNNRLYLFGVAIGSNHEFMNSFDGTVWTGWTEVSGNGITNLPLTATVFNNHLDLFGVGIGSNQEFLNSFDGNVWSGWSDVGGAGTTNLALAATVLGNNLYIFSVASGSNRESTNSFDGNVWSGWREVGGGGTTNLSLATTIFNGHIHLFGIGSNTHEFVNILQ